MNGYFIAVGVVLILAFLVHIIAGTKIYSTLNPRKNNQGSENLYEVWLLGCTGIQMISVDLLISAIFVLLMGLNIIPYTLYLALFIMLLYVGYTIAWLATLIYMRAQGRYYLRLCQWILFLIVSILMGLGIGIPI